MTVPYVYYLRWNNPGLHYIGCRHAKGCHPNDLWAKYKTHSAYVKHCMLYDPDVIRVVRICSSAADAKHHETRLLKLFNAAKSDAWLNMSNGDKEFVCTGHSEDTKKKFRTRKVSEETRKKISETNRKLSDEERATIGKRAAKKYRETNPNYFLSIKRYQSSEKYLKKKEVYSKEYESREEVKERRKLYRQTPEWKEKERIRDKRRYLEKKKKRIKKHDPDSNVDPSPTL